MHKKYTVSAFTKGAIGGGMLLFPHMFGVRLHVRRYQLASPKIQTPLRLAHLSDLHSCWYGPGGADLLRAVRDYAPDAVVLTGDIADNRIPHRNTLALVQKLAARYPTYYVSGNHEHKSGDLPALKATFTGLGAEVLEGSCALLTVGDTHLQICGVDDPSLGNLRFLQQIDSAADMLNPEWYSVLLTHRPEYARWYARYPFDLVLAGHAHGGQWRIPGIANGLYAVDQGILPAFAGGRYALGSTTLIISRGLSREMPPIPRLFNPPELVMVDLVAPPTV